MNDPPPGLRCVFDTSVVINFIHIDRLDLLGGANQISGYFPQEARVTEIIRREQTAKLEVAIANGSLETITLDTSDELVLFGTLRDRYGIGESAALALARTRAMHLGCDERRSFMTIVTNHLGAGRCLNTPTLLLRAVRLGVISVGEADTYKIILEGHRFRMGFASFQDLPL